MAILSRLNLIFFQTVQFHLKLRPLLSVHISSNLQSCMFFNLDQTKRYLCRVAAVKSQLCYNLPPLKAAEHDTLCLCKHWIALNSVLGGADSLQPINRLSQTRPTIFWYVSCSMAFQIPCSSIWMNVIFA